MPWYYAGREATPVGPVTLEELQALRLEGKISIDTYVIEHDGRPETSRAWKRYRDAFPASVLPASPPPAVPPISFPQPQPTPAHPLFPSATPAHSLPPYTAAPHWNPPSHAKTNSWCGWGLGLGLCSLLLIPFTCGISAFLALPALPISIVGLYQVHKNRDQGGQGLAITGLLLSCFSIFILLIFTLSLSLPFINIHEQTTTEQSTNDSE